MEWWSAMEQTFMLSVYGSWARTSAWHLLSLFRLLFVYFPLFLEAFGSWLDVSSRSGNLPSSVTDRVGVRDQPFTTTFAGCSHQLLAWRDCIVTLTLR